MKKIMFNDLYGLTQAVLEGRKTQTRRIAYQGTFKRYCNCGFCTEGKDKGKLFINDGNEIVAKSTYKIGEVVAVAQRYRDLLTYSEFKEFWKKHSSHAWNNKMFVSATKMPHQIKITRIRVDYLQGISEADCIKEGIFIRCYYAYSYDATNDRQVRKHWYRTPIEAYKNLCDKLKLHWESNPLVFVYDFELVK